jgi:hypothetical protein
MVGCISCNLPNLCVNCKIGYDLISSVCFIKICTTPGMIFDGVECICPNGKLLYNGICSECPDNCLKCDNTSCVQCKRAFYKTTTNVCVNCI